MKSAYFLVEKVKSKKRDLMILRVVFECFEVWGGFYEFCEKNASY